MPAPATSLEDEIVLSTTDEVLDALGMALSLPAELDSLEPMMDEESRTENHLLDISGVDIGAVPRASREPPPPAFCVPTLHAAAIPSNAMPAAAVPVTTMPAAALRAALPITSAAMPMAASFPFPEPTAAAATAAGIPMVMSPQMVMQTPMAMQPVAVPLGQPCFPLPTAGTAATMVTSPGGACSGACGAVCGPVCTAACGAAAVGQRTPPPSTGGLMQGIFLPSLSEMPTTGLSPLRGNHGSPGGSVASDATSDSTPAPGTGGTGGKSPRSFLQQRAYFGAAGSATAPAAFRRIDPTAVRDVSLARSQASFNAFVRRKGKHVPNGSVFAAALPVGLPTLDRPRSADRGAQDSHTLT